MKFYVMLIVLCLLANGCTTRPAQLTETAGLNIKMPVVPQMLVTEETHRLRRQQPMIMIDPGHGGEDFGTEAPTKPAFKEKNLNLVTARMLQHFLQQMGYQVAMTRTDDTFVTLINRAKLANEKPADLFVSLHYNSAPNPKAEGVEVFYFRSDENKSRSDASKALAQKILNRIIAGTEAKSRGVKHGNLSVIRRTGMPAVLVEGGFMTNEKELNNLKDGNYIKKIAWSIAQGIQEYLKTEKS